MSDLTPYNTTELNTWEVSKDTTLAILHAAIEAIE